MFPGQDNELSDSGTEEVFSPSKPTYDYCFLGYYDAQINRQVPTIRRNLLPPSYTMLNTIPVSCMKSVTAGTAAITGEMIEEQSCEIPEYGIGAFLVLGY